MLRTEAEKKRSVVCQEEGFFLTICYRDGGDDETGQNMFNTQYHDVGHV
jgi:hypothetical protein